MRVTHSLLIYFQGGQANDVTLNARHTVCCYTIKTNNYNIIKIEKLYNTMTNLNIHSIVFCSTIYLLNFKDI